MDSVAELQAQFRAFQLVDIPVPLPLYLADEDCQNGHLLQIASPLATLDDDDSITLQQCCAKLAARVVQTTVRPLRRVARAAFTSPQRDSVCRECVYLSA